MKPARSPRLLTLISIALFLLWFGNQTIRQIPGEYSKTIKRAGPDQAIAWAPTVTSPARKEMANTGPVWAQAFSRPIQVLPPSPTAKSRSNLYSPAFKRFIEQVADGQKGVIKGVYAPGIFALPVVQQPPGEWAFVSDKPGIVTEFQSAAKNGVTGFLAHNYLSGAQFYKLEIGKEVRVVYGDKMVKFYQVDGIYRFQKLTPSSPQSELIDLDTHQKITTEEVFNRFYRGKPKVTFQTCLEEEGLSNWGLTFTVAIPYEDEGKITE